MIIFFCSPFSNPSKAREDIPKHVASALHVKCFVSVSFPVSIIENKAKTLIPELPCHLCLLAISCFCYKQTQFRRHKWQVGTTPTSQGSHHILTVHFFSQSQRFWVPIGPRVLPTGYALSNRFYNFEVIQTSFSAYSRNL